MEKLKKLFFEYDLTWKRLIIYSIICGALTGILMIIPGIPSTSIGNIGATFEAWVMLALFIILNSKKPLEAGIKTIVFFLISQPLCYLVQVPFSWRGFEIFEYYGYWFIITLLTFPGAILAWFVKKDKWYSVAIFSVASAILRSFIWIFS